MPEYHKVDLLRDSKEHHIKSFLLTKAADWCYEEEWRIFDTNGPGERFFPEELLVGVILGALMSAEDKKYVVNLIGKRNFAVKIYQASVSKGSFSLDIEAYEPFPDSGTGVSPALRRLNPATPKFWLCIRALGGRMCPQNRGDPAGRPYNLRGWEGVWGRAGAVGPWPSPT